MDWSQSVLLLLSLLFAEITCSGFLHIRLQSQYRQEAKLIVGPQDKLSSIVVPIRLHSNTIRKLGPFPIEFNENYTMTINGGGVEELGINRSTYTAKFEPTRGTLAPIQLHLPLNGLELIFECDDQWSGSKCDIRCSNDCSTDLANETMAVSTDYSIDMTKLPEIVNRWKETTEVENDIRREENEKAVLEASNPWDTPVKIHLPPPKKRVENQKDVLGAREWMIQDMLRSLSNSKVSIEKSTDQTPIQVDMQTKENGNVIGNLPFTGTFAGGRKKDDEESKIEKHSAVKKTFDLSPKMLSLFLPRGSSGGKSSDNIAQFQKLLAFLNE